jgi:uncharacterized protein (TIGR02246 family)
MTRTSDVQSRIQSANDQFVSAYNRGDGKAVARLYTSEGQLFPAHSDVVRGTQAIGKFWQSVIDSGLGRATLESVELHANGDTAVEVGKYQLFASGDTPADHGKYMVLWKKDGEAWKLHRDIWTTNRPAG